MFVVFLLIAMAIGYVAYRLSPLGPYRLVCTTGLFFLIVALLGFGYVYYFLP